MSLLAATVIAFGGVAVLSSFDDAKDQEQINAAVEAKLGEMKATKAADCKAAALTAAQTKAEEMMKAVPAKGDKKGVAKKEMKKPLKPTGKPIEPGSKPVDPTKVEKPTSNKSTGVNDRPGGNGTTNTKTSTGVNDRPGGNGAPSTDPNSKSAPTRTSKGVNDRPGGN